MLADDQLIMHNHIVGDAFQVLQPVCVQVAKEPTVSLLCSLQKLVQSLPNNTTQYLLGYILFPLRVIIKTGKHGDKLTTKAFETIHMLLQSAEMDSLNSVMDMMASFSIAVDARSGQVHAVTSEEGRLAAVECLSDLFVHISDQLLSQVYNCESLPTLGHTVSVLLLIAEKERNRDLQLAALTGLLNAMQCDRRVNKDVDRCLGDVFASFLPGICTAACKIATGDPKQGHKVICAAVKTCWYCVVLVLGDHSLQLPLANVFTPPPHSESTNPQGPTSAGRFTSLMVQRDTKWVKETKVKVAMLLERIKVLCGHDNWRIHLALVDWATELYLKCSVCHDVLASPCLEVLVSLICNPYPRVATACQKAFDAIRKNGLGLKVLDILEEDMFTLCSQLPRLLRTAGDTDKVTRLRLVNGYIQLLGGGVSRLLQSYTHLQRLTLALIQSLELECGVAGLIQDQGPVGLQQLANDTNSSGFRKCFKNFHNVHVREELFKTCYLLGHYGDLEIISDHLTDLFQQSSLYRKEILLINNEVFDGWCQARDPQCSRECVTALIHSVLPLYIDEEYFSLPIPTDSDPIDSPGTQWAVVPVKTVNRASLNTVNSNIIQTCLVLEAMAVFAKVLCADFQSLLMDVLCPLLEKVACTNMAVSQTALYTLDCVSSACQYSGIPELLKHNADYLVSSLSIRLRHLDRYPAAPQVLCVMLRHGEPDILPLVEDIVQQVCSCIDNSYEDQGLMLMSILYCLTERILYWFPPPQIKSCPAVKDCDDDDIDISSESMAKFFRDYIETKRLAEGHVSESDLSFDDEEPVNKDGLEDDEFENKDGRADDEETVDAEEDKKPDLPYHVQKLNQVLDKCVHMLSSHSPHVRLVTLDTIDKGLRALQQNDDTLLPLVHQLWSPFLHRLKDQEPAVMLKACKLLHTFADVAKDFIRKRVMQDVMPKLIDFLKKQSSNSLNVGAVYHHTYQCKLQLQILTDVGFLCRLTDVQGLDVHPVILACVTYLSIKQPSYLQQATVESLKDLAMINSDLVWLVLSDIYCPNQLIPPSTAFANIQMAGSRTANDFSQNIDRIMAYL